MHLPTINIRSTEKKKKQNSYIIKKLYTLQINFRRKLIFSARGHFI